MLAWSAVMATISPGTRGLPRQCARARTIPRGLAVARAGQRVARSAGSREMMPWTLLLKQHCPPAPLVTARLMSRRSPSVPRRPHPSGRRTPPSRARETPALAPTPLAVNPPTRASQTTNRFLRHARRRLLAFRRPLRLRPAKPVAPPFPSSSRSSPSAKSSAEKQRRVLHVKLRVVQKVPHRRRRSDAGATKRGGVRDAGQDLHRLEPT